MTRRKLEIDEQSLIQNIISKRQLIIDGLINATHIDDWLSTEAGRKHAEIIRSFHITFKYKLEQANSLGDFYTAMLGQTPRHVPGMQHVDSIRPTCGIVHFQTPGQIKEPIKKSSKKKQAESLAKINQLLVDHGWIKDFLLKAIDKLNAASNDYLDYLAQHAPDHCLDPPPIKDGAKTPELTQEETVQIITPPKLRRCNQHIVSKHDQGLFMHRHPKHKSSKSLKLHAALKS